MDAVAIVNGLPAAYASLLTAFSSISVAGTLSADKAITFFFAPSQSPDGSRAVGFSVILSVSGSYGTSTSSWGTGGGSYYSQIAPSQTVPFR